MLKMFMLSLILGSTLSCGKKRPTKYAVDNGDRVSKEALSGEFYFLKTISSVETPGRGIGQYLFPGIYLKQGSVVKFEFKENTMDVIAVDNGVDQNSPREQTSIFASFPVSHVDVLWAKNSDDKDTRIQEETQSRNSWWDRDYVVIDTSADRFDVLGSEYTKSATAKNRIQIDPETKAINFYVEKILNDGSIITEHYSFMGTQTNETYVPKEYTASEKKIFGFFDTVTYEFNKHGRVTTEDLRRYINKWDTTENVVYYLSPNFPEHLIEETKAVFNQWNDTFEEVIGKRLFELRLNTGQEIGDMRYNMIVYVDDQSSRSILGYGPSYSDPKTGRIIKADVYLYGATLKRAIYSERQWLDEFDSLSLTFDKNSIPPLPSGVPSGKVTQVQNNHISNLKKSYKIDQEMLKQLTGISSDYEGLLEKFRTPEYEDYRKITMLTPEFLAPIREMKLASELSDEEIEVKIFGPLLAHELGHNFGLRHNFMGSADSDYFHDSVETSTVMDYTLLSSKDANGPGDYDDAAIKFAYGDDTKRTESLSKKYFFCTDEDLYRSKTPLCSQFDSGSNLTDLVNNQFDKYTIAYNLNNVRGDRAFFNQNIAGYINSVFRYLIPFRIVIDNANAINEFASMSYDPGTDSEVYVFRGLWELLGKRIESDEDTDASNEVEVEISSGVPKKFDISKIQGLLTEASNAKAFSASALMAIVMETTRPNYDSYDVSSGELAVRGVLLDKLIALLILAQDTSDPLGRGTVATAFTDLEEEIGDIFIQIISNTRVSGGARTFSIWDANIKSMALNLLKDLTRPGKQTSEMIELLRLIDVTIPTDVDDANIASIDASNVKIRDWVHESLGTSVTATRIGELSTLINDELFTRNTIDLATVRVKDRHFKTPMDISFGTLDFVSATGLLIRDTINQFEVNVDAYELALADLDAEIVLETDSNALLQLLLRRENYRNSQNAYRRFVNQEKRFIEEIYSIYHPNR